MTSNKDTPHRGTGQSDRKKAVSVSTRRPVRALAALAVALTFTLGTIDTADARAGRSSSSGSRGARTYQAPPATNTAPSTALPMERSAAPAPQAGAMRPGAPASRPGFFSGGGFMPGLMGGLLGAGIVGLLFGGGFLSGLGSFSGILGFLLQILLIVFLVRLAMRFFRGRAAGGMNRTGAGAMNRGGPAYAGAAPLNRESVAGAGYAGAQRGTGYGSGAGGTGTARPVDALGIGPADYEAFEAILGTVQTAYGREDLNTLRGAVTPEMASYFSQELADNHNRGVINQLSDVRLLQGDLAESWREGNAEYATVAMRFSLIDVTVERATGRVVQGDPNRPDEVTEVWTFARPRGGRWALSAIQQTR